jgi:glyoxylase-like metal-dependent hydrolase (beta-lactamase superfamily II)
MSVAEEAREAPLGLTGAVAPLLLATKLAIPSPAPSLVLRPRLTTRLEHAGSRVVRVIAAAKKSAPGKPIRHIVLSHFHDDHMGGVRTYAAEGAIVVVHSSAGD